MKISSTHPPNPTLEKNLQKISFQREQIFIFCQKYPILKLYLFGSILREDFIDKSDIDFWVEFSPNARVGYFELTRYGK